RLVPRLRLRDVDLERSKPLRLEVAAPPPLLHARPVGAPVRLCLDRDLAQACEVTVGSAPNQHDDTVPYEREGARRRSPSRYDLVEAEPPGAAAVRGRVEQVVAVLPVLACSRRFVRHRR